MAAFYCKYDGCGIVGLLLSKAEDQKGKGFCQDHVNAEPGVQPHILVPGPCCLC